MISEKMKCSLFELLDKCSRVALDIYNRGYQDYTIIMKEDKSPVTEADLAVNDVIMRELPKISPNIPIVSEEVPIPPWSERKHWESFWLIDPIDGTKDFTQHSGEWTVNIALIHKGKIAAGFLALPAFEEVFYGIVGEGAWLIHAGETIPLCRVGKSPEQWEKSGDSPRILASVNHREPELDEYIARFVNPEVTSAGSCLKICRLAENKGDIYPRTYRLKEWDIAAAHAVLKGAGGNIFYWGTKDEVEYNNEDLRAPCFEAW
jgi:3'(2'), 5'-bisphosphate nucleotidase